jgi:uncharacterized OsmC-like protein
MFINLVPKAQLHILYLYGTVICCCMLYNLILNEKNYDVESLIVHLKVENQLVQLQ